MTFLRVRLKGRKYDVEEESSNEMLNIPLLNDIQCLKLCTKIISEEDRINLAL